jgi:hypothetical protein
MDEKKKDSSSEYLAEELEKLDITIEEPEKHVHISLEEKVEALEKEVARLNRANDELLQVIKITCNTEDTSSRAYELLIDDMKIRCKCGKLK